MTTEYRAGCAEIRPLMAVVVLGLAEPAEHDAVVAHLAWCRDCAAIQAELEPLPAVLANVDPADVEDLPPLPDGLLQRTLAETSMLTSAESAERSRRRRRFRRGLGVALAGAAAATLLVVVSPWSDQQGPTGGSTTVVAAVADPVTHVSGRFVITGADTGSQVRVALTGVAPGEHCRLVTLASDGRHQTAASWVARYDGTATVTGHSWLAPSDVSGLQVVTQDGQTLLRASAADLRPAD